MRFRNLFFIAFLASTIVAINGCVDQDFDAPPAGGVDPDITPNTSIAALKAMHTIGEYEEIKEDLIIEAIVISDDSEGNFFRQLIIQDETGGIEMRIDVTDLNTIYPPGRKVFVKCRGLWLGDFNGLTQLGAALIEVDGDQELARIPDVLLDDYVITGTFGNIVVPEVKAIQDLTAADVSTLIQLEGVQFIDQSAGVPYADAVNLFSVNHTIEDCNKQSLILRTSGYASFASEFTPIGNGTITGVLGIFGNDLQILLRDLEDVDLNGERCAIGGGNQVTIKSLRDAYAGGTGIAGQGFIEGVVISDYTSATVTGRNLFIQDETAGIVVRFDERHSYALGEKIQVDVTGQELSDFNGLVQVNNVPLGNAQSLGAGTLPEPRNTTIAEILSNLNAWESTLVYLENVTLSGNSTFSGSVDVTDASGTIELYTRNDATFATNALPTGEVDLTAIVSRFNDPQLIIRNPEDVGGGMTGGGERVTIQSLRDAYSGGAGSAGQGYIQGVVISDYTSASVTGRNLYIQDETAGIVVRFDTDHSYALGEEIEVDVTGEELSDFNGLVQVNNVPVGKAKSLGAGTPPTPRKTTISEILSNAGPWESTLVSLDDVTLSGNAVFSGSVDVTDATGTMVLYTRSAADFANEALPDENVDLVAILSTFNEPQLIIRNPDDLNGGSTGGTLINEDFSSLSDDDDVALPGWVNIAVKGERLWRVQEFDGNKYAQATAFNDNAAEMETWLITPEIDLATPKSISFETAKAFFDHDGLTIWASTDFDGSDISSANWTQLEVRIAEESDPDHAWIQSGAVDLGAFTGKVRVAFQYTGSGPDNKDTSFRVDNVVVSGQ